MFVTDLKSNALALPVPFGRRHQHFLFPVSGVTSSVAELNWGCRIASLALLAAEVENLNCSFCSLHLETVPHIFWHWSYGMMSLCLSQKRYSLIRAQARKAQGPIVFLRILFFFF